MGAGHDGLRVADIARETGRHRNTVLAKLQAMFKAGMAEPTLDGCWVAVDGADLDEAAVLLGVAGVQAEQARQHSLERRRRATLLDRGRAVRETDE